MKFPPHSCYTVPLSRLVERVEHPEWSYDGPGQLHGLPPKVEQLRPHHLLLQILQLPGHRGNVQVPVVAAPQIIRIRSSDKYPQIVRIKCAIDDFPHVSSCTEHWRAVHEETILAQIKKKKCKLF